MKKALVVNRELGFKFCLILIDNWNKLEILYIRKVLKIFYNFEQKGFP